MAKWDMWIVHLTTLGDGSVACSLRSCLDSRESVVLLNERYSDSDVLFQELLTLLDSSIWSSLAERQIELLPAKHGGRPD